MSKIYYYKKSNKKNPKLFLRIIGLFLTLIGLGITLYVFTPVILWEIFISPVLASQAMVIPIPKTIFLTPATIQSLISSQTNVLTGVDYTKASTWFPTYSVTGHAQSQIGSYTISIPRLHISNATVSTTDDDLAKHLVNLQGTAVPPNNGNIVIFGHSTLPQLYNASDYKTIFANIHTMQVGDNLVITVDNITYTYKIFSITVVSPDDTSVLSQTFDDSYLTIITCTPPGTVWMRLVIKARLQKL